MRHVAPRFAYLLWSGIASVVVSMIDGETAEVGMIGREGVVGTIHFLGSSPVLTICFIQLEATALKIPMLAFRWHSATAYMKQRHGWQAGS